MKIKFDTKAISQEKKMGKKQEIGDNKVGRNEENGDHEKDDDKVGRNEEDGDHEKDDDNEIEQNQFTISFLDISTSLDYWN